MTSTAPEVPVPVAPEPKAAEPKRESKAETGSPAPAAAQQKQGLARGSEKKPRRDGQHKGKHQIEIPENAERDIGVVVSHQDKFGFVKSINRDARYFFHVNDTDGHTATSARVSFIVAKDLTTGRDVAYDVRVLPPGHSAGGDGRSTLPLGTQHNNQHHHQQQQQQPGHPHGQGQGGRRGSAQASAQGSRSGGGGGEMTWGEEKAARAAVAASAAATAAMADKEAKGAASGTPRGGASPQPPKEAAVASEGESGSSSAAAVPPQQSSSSSAATPGAEAAAAPAPRAPKAAHAGPQQYAHFGGKGQLPREAHQGAEQQGQQRAKKRNERLPGKFRGSVVQVARGARSVQLDDGCILYQDPATGIQYEAKYGNYRLADGVHQLEVGDQVEVEVLLNQSTGLRRAANVRFLGKSIEPSLDVCIAAAAAVTAENGAAAAAVPAAPAAAPAAAAPAAEPQQQAQQPAAVPAPAPVPEVPEHVVQAPVQGRQLGRVALLKKEFGFIRQMERPGDMFFHFSQLDGIPPQELKVGDDVEYSVRRDGQDGKVSAVLVCRAPPGAVVFDIVSEETCRGVVLEKPAPTKQYGQTSGLIEYVPLEGGHKAKITFATADAVQLQPMRMGDHVSFRIATNVQAAKAAARSSNPAVAAHAGRRAVEVAMVRLPGTVVATKGQFGFIAYRDSSAGGGSGGAAGAGANGEAERKVFFHNNEVLGGVQLKQGDEVSFVLHTHTKTGELNAQRVKRTKEAPEGLPPPDEAAAVPDRNPNQVKFVGNLGGGEHKKQAQPKGPDGGRGFSLGRGRGLPALPGAVLHPLAPGAAAAGTAPSPFAALARAAPGAHPLPLPHHVPLAALPAMEVSEAAIDATKLEILRSLATGGQKLSLSGPLNPSAVAFVPRSASMERFVSAVSDLSTAPSVEPRPSGAAGSAADPRHEEGEGHGQERLEAVKEAPKEEGAGAGKEGEAAAAAAPASLEGPEAVIGVGAEGEAAQAGAEAAEAEAMGQVDAAGEGDGAGTAPGGGQQQQQEAPEGSVHGSVHAHPLTDVGDEDEDEFEEATSAALE